jgi:hypothetical protein
MEKAVETKVSSSFTHTLLFFPKEKRTDENMPR